MKGVITLSIELKSRPVKPRKKNRKTMILEVLACGDPGGMTADDISVVRFPNLTIAISSLVCLR